VLCSVRSGPIRSDEVRYPIQYVQYSKRGRALPSIQPSIHPSPREKRRYQFTFPCFPKSVQFLPCFITSQHLYPVPIRRCKNKNNRRPGRKIGGTQVVMRIETKKIRYQKRPLRAEEQKVPCSKKKKDGETNREGFAASRLKKFVCVCVTSHSQRV